MSDPRNTFIEFALLSWSNRYSVMLGSPKRRTNNIYNYYHKFESIRKPAWRAQLDELKMVFGGLGQFEFWFQNFGQEKFNGHYIVRCCDKIVDITEGNDRLLDVHMEIAEKYGYLGKFDKKKRHYTSPNYTLKKSVSNDPAFIFDNFLWNQGPRARDGASYRIYVTPKPLHCARVFSDIVKYINKKEIRIRGLKLSTLKAPQLVKMIVPGPHSYQRADKIVMYCHDKKQLESGLIFLKDYQKINKHDFENASPRSTRPAPGLIGVAYTPQPTPDAELMARAGKTRINGMSFGMSRAAVIYLALNDHYNPKNPEKENPINFLNSCFVYAKKAGLNIAVDI